MFKNKFKLHFGLSSLILIVVCAALITADLVTKHFAKADLWLAEIIPGWVKIDGSVPNNPGCAFSFLNENPEIGQPILISVTFIMLVALVAAFMLLPQKFLILKTAIALVVAGAIGNLVDRLMFRSVRDFFGLNMLFSTRSLVYCNLADFWIVIGSILALVDLIFLNEWAIFPLTKSAKAAQAKRREDEQATEDTEAEEGSFKDTCPAKGIDSNTSEMTSESDIENDEN